MMILAQIGGSGSGDAATIPRLPEPPLLAHYLLENPWPVAIALLIGGAIGMMLLGRIGRRDQGMRLLFAGIALACLTVMVGYLVTTEREVMSEQTRRLVDATATASTGEMSALLTEQARIGSFGTYVGARGREEVVDQVRRKIDEFGPLQSHEIGSVQAVQDGPNIGRTQVRVWVRPRKDVELYGAAMGMWFRIEWRREGEGPWRASVITMMQADPLGVNPDLGRE